MISMLRGKYFEELPVGFDIYTSARTITEADVTTFAGFSGDYNPLHTDSVFAAKSSFKERIAHGLISLAFTTGFLDKLGLYEGTAAAFLGLQWKFKKAVKIGDSISAYCKVINARLTSRQDTGIVTFDIRVVNQQQDIIGEGNFDMMILARTKTS